MSHLLVCTFGKMGDTVRLNLMPESDFRDCKRLFMGHGSEVQVSTGSEL